MATDKTSRRSSQVGIGVGVLILAGLWALGAAQIRPETGYSGVGANFLPWVVAAVLAVCGINLLFEAFTGGYRQLEDDPGMASPDWLCAAWVSAGLLLNAFLITRLGFVLSCALLFLLASRGFRLSLGQRPSSAHWLRDGLVGLALSAPVFWVFTKGLGLNLPGLTSTGWI